MKKINYKGRCEKRKVSKCEGICRTYNKIQSAFVDELENDDNILSFECNVLLKGVANDLYSSDFVAKRVDRMTAARSNPRRFYNTCVSVKRPLREYLVFRSI